MSNVTIHNLRVAPGLGVRTPTKGRVYPDADFQLNDTNRTEVTKTSPLGGPHFKEFSLSSSGGYYSAADFTLPPTTDSPNNPNGARWAIHIFDQHDQWMYGVGDLKSFALDHTQATQDVEDIFAFNNGGLPTLSPKDREVAGNLTVGGALTGSAAGLHSFPGAASLVNNAIVAAGSAGINADSNGDGVGEAYFSINSVTKFRATQDGLKVEALVPFKLRGYTTDSLPSGEEGFAAWDTDRHLPVFFNGDDWLTPILLNEDGEVEVSNLTIQGTSALTAPLIVIGGGSEALRTNAGTIATDVAGNVFGADLSNTSDFNETAVLLNTGPINTVIRLGFTDEPASGASIAQIQAYRNPGGGGTLEFRTRQPGDTTMFTHASLDPDGTWQFGRKVIFAGNGEGDGGQAIVIDPLPPIYDDNAAALADLIPGELYRPTADPGALRIVHA